MVLHRPSIVELAFIAFVHARLCFPPLLIEAFTGSSVFFGLSSSDYYFVSSQNSPISITTNVFSPVLKY